MNRAGGGADDEDEDDGDDTLANRNLYVHLFFPPIRARRSLACSNSDAMCALSRT